MRTITSIAAIFVAALALGACSSSGTDIPEDMFEPNNDSASATPTAANSGYEGRLFDEDWFQIEVTSGFERVVANLAFTHADGDIDLELVDASGNVLATSESTTNNEHIDVTVSTSGIYYLRLFSASYTGNSYTLSWMLDDELEPNDSILEARPATANTGYPGIQFDDDWFRIEVTTGFERVVANLTFTHADGDIDLELVDASGNVLATSQSTTDNEQIDFTVSSSGSYYLRVFDFNNGSGNIYTLIWSGTAPPPADDPYEDNDDRASATDLPENTAFNGVQLDQDWYHISVAPGFERVAADLTFANANGDLDLRLYDSVGTLLATSNSNSNDFETIVFDVSASGDYYLKIYNNAQDVDPVNNAGTANTYSLTWEGRAPVDDLFEPNNDAATATDLAENTGISGIQLDEDWYRISVSPGSQHLVIDLTFIHSAGDLDIVLYNSAVAYRASSESSNDNEQIDFTVTSGGTYYLQIYDGTTVGGSTGNTYDLIWTSSP